MSDNITFLKETCKNIRKDVFQMINNVQCGHLGGSLSCVEILVCLYFQVMNIDPLEPRWEERDRFINSKGHATAAYYATLAHRGYFKREELISSFINVRSHFEEHGSVSVPGVDISTGSLGQGVSVGAGMALAAKLHKRSYKTYVLVGDGECQEGQIWEAAMFGAQYELGNLVVIIDKNDLQVSGKTKDVISVDPLAQKWSSFNWDVHSADGHDPEQVLDCLGSLSEVNSPKVLITQTVKGKGISFMENNPDWHSFRKLTGEELKIAEQELGLQ